MVWKSENGKRDKEHIAIAACTITSYDLHYKSVTGKYGLENWLKQNKDAVVHFNIEKQV